MSRKLSIAEVSRILGLREAQIREIVRSGICGPPGRGRGYSFSFQDLVVLRAAQGLLQQRVPAARVRRALAALLAELPPERPLSGLRIQADGRHVAVCDGDATWQPETGQILLDFDLDALARRAEAERRPPDPRLLAAHPGARAQAELERALELEDSDPKAAARAYGRALELDPGLIDAYVNLGRIAHEAGDAREAARLYALALERSPEDPVIHFNLALALEDTRGAGDAVAHYERALRLDPEFADAHYNLAGLCEQLGRGADAIRHYRAYKRLTEG